MKKIVGLFILLFSLSAAFGQSTYPIRTDTLDVYKNGGNAEFKLQNGTRTIQHGILSNADGRGVTRFYKTRISNDTLFIGGDTIKIPATVGGGGGSASSDSLKHLPVDTGARGRQGWYLAFDSVNRKWYLQQPTAAQLGYPDTVSIQHMGSGAWGIYANGTATLYDKTDSGEYGVIIINRPDSVKGFSADTAGVHALVSKDRLNALQIPVFQNLGTGYRIYKPYQGNRTLFTDFGANWDSVKNTNGLTLIIDTTKFATRAWVLGQIGTGGGGSPGTGGPDTVTINHLGDNTTLPLLQAHDNPILDSRDVANNSYGILTDTAGPGRSLRLLADTGSLHGLLSKDRANGLVSSADGHPKASYGTHTNLDSVKTDSFMIKAAFVGNGIVTNNPAVGNEATITLAGAIAFANHKNVELPSDTIYLKNNFTLYPGVHYYSAGKQTVFKGNFGSDHVLVTYNSATPINDIGFHNITFDRRGPNTSHGTMFGNVHYLYFENCKWIDDDATAAGGSLGVSCFSPWATYPSDHIFIKDCEFVGSGNFAAQFGNTQWVYIDGMDGFRNYREFIGIEPYGLGGELGVVKHVVIRNAHNYNPDNTAINGSATGVMIITNSSAGRNDPLVMDDIVLENVLDSGGSQSSMHGFHILGGYNVTLKSCRSVSTGGYGYQVTSSAYGPSSYVKFIDCYARNNGRDGTRIAGLRVHDATYCDFDIRSEGNVNGVIEDGTSAHNIFRGDVSQNTTPITLNTGRPYFSVLRDMITDTTYPRSSIMAYRTNQGSRIIAERATGFPLLDIHTADSLYGGDGGGGTPATTIYNGDGVLSADRSIGGNGKNLKIGTTGNRIIGLDLFSSSNVTTHGVPGVDAFPTIGDASYTASNANAAFQLPVITANRVFTPPTALAGSFIYIENLNPSNNFGWAVPTGLFKDVNGSIIYSIPNSTFNTYFFDGTSWVRIGPSGFGRQIITAGGTQTLSQSNIIGVVNPATTLSSLAVQMPATPIDGQMVYVDFGGTINAVGAVVANNVSVVPNTGQTIIGSVLAKQIAGNYFSLRYYSPTSSWYVEANNAAAAIAGNNISGKQYDSVSANGDSSTVYYWHSDRSLGKDSVVYTGGGGGSGTGGGSGGTGGYAVYQSGNGTLNVTVNNIYDEYQLRLEDLNSGGGATMVEEANSRNVARGPGANTFYYTSTLSLHSNRSHSGTFFDDNGAITGANSRVGNKFVVYNRNNGANKWVFASDTYVYDKTETLITTIPDKTTYELDYWGFDGTHYIWYQH